MNKILFTTLMGIPSSDTGGPNKIIFELLKFLDYNSFDPYYLSYQLQKKVNANYTHPELSNMKLSFKKNMGQILYKKVALYMKFVSSNIYLNYYYKKVDKHFYSVMNSYPKIGIIHSHDTFAGYYSSFIENKNKILTIHSKGLQTSELIDNIDSQRYYLQKKNELIQRERVAFNNNDIIVFPSIASKNLFINELEVNDYKDKNIKVIYNGVDVDRINNIKSNDDIFGKYNIKIEKDCVTFMNVAQHVRQKNINLLIEAMNILINKINYNCVLINIGTGSLTIELKKLVHKYGLDNRVLFLGKIPYDDVIRFMKKCEIFLMSSEKVVFDLAILEALSCGMCVIASNEGGNKEVIEDGVNGYLFDDVIPDSIVKTIKGIDIQKVKKNAELTGKSFTSKRMAEEYYKIYNEYLH